MAEFIGDFYYVVSKNSGTIYKINKDLHCTCIAGSYKKECKHVKEVIKELNEGKFVPTKNSVLTKEFGFQNNRIFMGPEQARFF